MEKIKPKKITKEPKKQKEVKKKEKSASKIIEKKPKKVSSSYIEAIGRRKTSVARVRVWTRGEKEFFVNNKALKDYFPDFETQKIAGESLDKMKSEDKFKIQVLVKGGGFHSQAEAVRHGIARALVKFNSDFRKRLKKAGHLTRDPRMRERKKFGLKRARRAPQWRKR
ncbi:30S ribosomal protein S9 [Candidatus Parcubacteria bacterium]|nr:30S ribosomal protein S9 [Candidatus Parcubacteria bacterium]